MGTKASSADEWFELYNTTESSINLSGWGVYEQGGAALVESLEGSIAPHRFFVVERTDDTSISSILADLSPSSWGGNGFANTGEHLVLKNGNGETVDELPCAAGWFSGDSSIPASMERISLEGGSAQVSVWGSANASKIARDASGTAFQGSPGEVAAESSTPSPSLTTQTNSSSLVPHSSAILSPPSLRFIEIASHPSAGNSEYVIIENNGDRSVPLSELSLADGSKTVALSTTSIASQQIDEGSSLRIEMVSLGIRLNDDGDVVTLSSLSGEVLSSVTIPSLGVDERYLYVNGGWQVIGTGSSSGSSDTRVATASTALSAKQTESMSSPAVDVVPVGAERFQITACAEDKGKSLVLAEKGGVGWRLTYLPQTTKCSVGVVLIVTGTVVNGSTELTYRIKKVISQEMDMLTPRVVKTEEIPSQKGILIQWSGSVEELLSQWVMFAGVTPPVAVSRAVDRERVWEEGNRYLLSGVLWPSEIIKGGSSVPVLRLFPTEGGIRDVHTAAVGKDPSVLGISASESASATPSASSTRFFNRHILFLRQVGYYVIVISVFSGLIYLRRLGYF